MFLSIGMFRVVVVKHTYHNTKWHQPFVIKSLSLAISGIFLLCTGSSKMTSHWKDNTTTVWNLPSTPFGTRLFLLCNQRNEKKPEDFQQFIFLSQDILSMDMTNRYFLLGWFVFDVLAVFRDQTTAPQKTMIQHISWFSCKTILTSGGAGFLEAKEVDEAELDVWNAPKNWFQFILDSWRQKVFFWQFIGNPVIIQLISYLSEILTQRKDWNVPVPL